VARYRFKRTIIDYQSGMDEATLRLIDIIGIILLFCLLILGIARILQGHYFQGLIAVVFVIIGFCGVVERVE